MIRDGRGGQPLGRLGDHPRYREMLLGEEDLSLSYGTLGDDGVLRAVVSRCCF